ncbi:hypothetical protein D3C71_1468360 [compost metagenome]
MRTVPKASRSTTSGSTALRTISPFAPKPTAPTTSTRSPAKVMEAASARAATPSEPAAGVLLRDPVTGLGMMVLSIWRRAAPDNRRYGASSRTWLSRAASVDRPSALAVRYSAWRMLSVTLPSKSSRPLTYSDAVSKPPAWMASTP